MTSSTCQNTSVSHIFHGVNTVQLTQIVTVLSNDAMLHVIASVSPTDITSSKNHLVRPRPIRTKILHYDNESLHFKKNLKNLKMTLESMTHIMK